MRFFAYAVLGIVLGGAIGAAGGFFGALEWARIMKIQGGSFGIAIGAVYMGFYLMLILGALGGACGIWRAWRFQRRAAQAE